MKNKHIKMVILEKVYIKIKKANFGICGKPFISCIYEAYFYFSTSILLRMASLAQSKSIEILDSASKIRVTSFQYDLEKSERSTDTAKLPFTKISFKDVRFDASFIAISGKIFIPLKYRNRQN